MSKAMEKDVQPTRLVLKGVPRIAFDVQPGIDAQTNPFPAALAACLEYMDEGLGWETVVWRGEPWRQSVTYRTLMGVTGGAFRLSWRPGWHLDNVEILYLSDDPRAVFDRAFEAVGREFEFVFPQEGQDNEAMMRQRIVESLRDRWRPVLGFGVVGPPECCIISGYDEGGEVLIGWSFFQGTPEFNAGVEFEPTGEFRKRGWFEELKTPIVIGERRAGPGPEAVYRDALAWAVRVVRTPLITAYRAERHNGLAAYTAWAEHLLKDEEFAGDDLGRLFERYMVHEDAVGTVAEGRWYAAHFLRQVAAGDPALEPELAKAAALYEAEHDLMWEVWALTGGPARTEAGARRLDERKVRERMAEIIERARMLDEEAVGHIEAALARGGG